MAPSRWIYVAAMAAGVCFLVLVGAAQSFARVPAIHARAPTMAEPPSAIAQLTVPAIFAAIVLRLRVPIGLPARLNAWPLPPA